MPAQPPAPPHDSSRLWTVHDVASYLSCSPSWVYRQAENGTLPCRRLGGLLRFDPEVIRVLGTPASGAVVRTTKRTTAPRRRRVQDAAPENTVKAPRRRAPSPPTEAPSVRRPGRYTREVFAWADVITGPVKVVGRKDG